MPRKKNKRKAYQAARRAAEKPKKRVVGIAHAPHGSSRAVLAVITALLKDTPND